MAQYKIYVAGVPFDCDHIVKTWHETGWDHAAERCVIAPSRCPGGIAAYGDTAINRRPNRFWYRKGLGHTKTPDLKAAQAAVRMFTVHHDGVGSAETCFKVLHDERGISVHFCIDNDGVIYQNLDLALMGFQAAGFNPWSIGVELNNRGNAIKWPGYYDHNGQNRRKKRGPERGSKKVRIHRSVIEAYTFTDPQYDAMVELAKALRYAMPNIPVEYPQERPGKQLYKMMDRPEKFSGYMGHYHQTTRKWDPGPFDFRRFIDRVKGTSCWPLATKKLEPNQCHEIPTDIEELRDDANALYRLNSSARGGYFPLAPYGERRLWHGGVHLPKKKGEPIRTPFAGRIVAARFGTTSAVGSNDFVLVRHDMTVGAISFRFYALYYHLQSELTAEKPPDWITVAADAITARKQAIKAALAKGETPKVSDVPRFDPTKKAVTQLISEPVKGGAIIGHVGEAGPPSARSAQVHFEIFSGDSIVSEVELTGLPAKGLWNVVDGTSGGRFCDTKEILDKIDKSPADGQIEASEISNYFRGSSRDLHFLAVLNTSEFYGTKQDWIRDLKTAPEFQDMSEDELDRYVGDQIEPTLWWTKKVARHARIPTDGVVFHFHPITFIRFLNEKVLEASVEDEDLSQVAGEKNPDVLDDLEDTSGESFFAESDLGEKADVGDYPLDVLVQGFPD